MLLTPGIFLPFLDIPLAHSLVLRYNIHSRISALDLFFKEGASADAAHHSFDHIDF